MVCPLATTGCAKEARNTSPTLFSPVLSSSIILIWIGVPAGMAVDPDRSVEEPFFAGLLGAEAVIAHTIKRRKTADCRLIRSIHRVGLLLTENLP
jgi:hypothetical protein